MDDGRYDFPAVGMRVMVYMPDPSTPHGTRVKRYAKFLGSREVFPSPEWSPPEEMSRSHRVVRLEFEDGGETVEGLAYCCYFPRDGQWVPMDLNIDSLAWDAERGFPRGDGGPSEPC